MPNSFDALNAHIKVGSPSASLAGRTLQFWRGASPVPRVNISSRCILLTYLIEQFSQRIVTLHIMVADSTARHCRRRDVGTCTAGILAVGPKGLPIQVLWSAQSCEAMEEHPGHALNATRVLYRRNHATTTKRE